MTAWWTTADVAESAVLVDGLVRGVLEHREHCAACASAGSAIYCKSVDKAIKIVLEWSRQRTLLSRAVYLRELQNAIDKRVMA